MPKRIYNSPKHNFTFVQREAGGTEFDVRHNNTSTRIGTLYADQGEIRFDGVSLGLNPSQIRDLADSAEALQKDY